MYAYDSEASWKEFGKIMERLSKLHRRLWNRKEG